MLDHNRLEKELEKLRSAINELTLLNEIAVAAGSALEVDEVLNNIVQKSIKALKAEQGSIMLVSQQLEKPFESFIRQNDFSQSMKSYKVGSHITGWVLKHQKPLIIADLENDDRFKVTEQEFRDIQTVLCVPIWYKAKIIGVLTVTNKKTGEPFGENDLRLLSIISTQAGQLIRNSQLQEEAHEKKRLQHEMQLAGKIQRDLVSAKPPATEMLDISSYFNPADNIGGDYFDYFDLGNNKAGIVIADVSGHGPSSALVMTMLKGILHSTNYDFISPEETLKRINIIMNNIMPVGMFVTMMFLVFDLESKKIFFSNAGHPPLIYFDACNNTCESIDFHENALNLSASSVYSDKEISFNKNDIFILYTDGVIEAENKNNEMLKISGLLEKVKNVATKSSNEIVSYIKNQVELFTEFSPQSDDIVIITIKIK